MLFPVAVDGHDDACLHPGNVRGINLFACYTANEKTSRLLHLTPHGLRFTLSKPDSFVQLRHLDSQQRQTSRITACDNIGNHDLCNHPRHHHNLR